MKKGYCIERIMASGEYHSRQCSRKSGHGPENMFCKQHAKNERRCLFILEERKEKMKKYLEALEENREKLESIVNDYGDMTIDEKEDILSSKIWKIKNSAQAIMQCRIDSLKEELQEATDMINFLYKFGR